MNENGCLYLTPNTIGNNQIDKNIPASVKTIIENLNKRPTVFVIDKKI